MTRPAYRSRPTYDVIVVGAGLTGAVAARELRHAGHHVLVLEARERVGGRIWTSDHFEEQRDLGATFVHWTQPHIWAEIARYRFPLTQRPPLERTVWRVGDERVTGDALALQQFIAEGMTEYCADAREVYPQPYARAATSRLEEVDELSMADRIATLSASDEVKAIIHGFWSVNCNRDCSEGALTHALHWLSLTGGDWRVFNEACARYKLAGGMGTLLAAILGEGRPTMHLSCPVDLIERTDDGVRVATSTHGEFRALACIVTAPLNSLDNIEFVPQLSTGKREAIVEGAPTGGFKLWVKLRNPIESCLCLAPGSEPLMFARYEARLSSGCLMGCYGADRDLLLGDRTAVQDAIESWLPGSIVEDVWTYDWAGDPYCRETWRVPRPRQLTRFAAELESPEGRVLLAGSDYARGWNGFMDGAVESALTSAHAVKALLA